MRLVRLSIKRVPGIADPFSLGPFQSDPVLVLGPNGSGKSTTRRALRAVLFGEKEYTRGVELDAVFEDRKGELTARLHGGKVSWERKGKPSPAPELPIATRASCFAVGVRDLLDDSGQSEEDLARAVRRQLTGGYDMEALLGGPFAIAPQEAKRPFETAVREREERQKLELELVGLSEQEDRLAGLREAREAAREAGREETRLELARRLHQARSAERAALAGLEAFDAGLEATTERDLELADELEREDREARELFERCEAKLASASGEQVEGVGGELEPGELERREVEIATLRELERDLEQARVREARAVAREDAARAELERAADEGSDEPQPELALLGPSELRELDAFFDELERLEDQRAAIEERLALLDARVDTKSRGNPHKGIKELREWLRAPVPDKLEVSPLWTIAGIVMIGLGIALSLLVHPLGAILAAAGAVPAMLQPFFGMEKRALMQRREAIANRYRNSDLEQPTKWQVQAVQDRLEDLEELVRDAEIAAEQRRDAEKLELELGRLDQQAAELTERGDELSQRFGMAWDQGRLARRELVHRLTELRAARAELAQVSAECRRLEQRSARLTKDLAAFLESVGCAPQLDGDEADSIALRVAFKRLAEAEGARREARRVREEALAERPALAARAERVTLRRAEFFADRGLELGDNAGLERLGVQRTAFLAAREKLAEFERERRRLSSELEGHEDLAELPEEELASRVEAARERASRSSHFDQEIGRISQKLDDERAVDRMGEAEARVAAAEERLDVKKRELLERAAAGFLLEDVAREYESQSRPDVLARAANLFADFTSDRYHLQVEGEADGTRVEFKARETDSNKRLSLRELSDGTRMQLLLGVRIAFAEEAERGESIPLVLDEAFSLSDSHRFRAMVGAVYDLVERGRQVFYMSANLHEDQIWKQLADELEQKPPTLIDMAKARKLAVAASSPQGLIVPMAPKVPSAKGKQPEDYAHELGVALVRPFAPAESLHLYHLLGDDLVLLERLLKSRIETLGQWRASSERGNGPSLAGDATRSRKLDARVGVAKAAIDHWHTGRGKPIGRVELEQADGVSDQRIDEVESLAKECEGDPKQLVAALRDKRIKGYRGASIDKLEGWLSTHGFLDGNEPLDLEALHRETLSAAKRFVTSGALQAKDVRDLADSLFRQLEVRSQAQVH